MGARVYAAGARVYASPVIIVSAQFLWVLTLGLGTLDLGLTIFGCVRSSRSHNVSLFVCVRALGPSLSRALNLLFLLQL